MKVLKFGGTSVSNKKTQENIISIIQNTSGKVILVMSAFSQITNKLETIASLNIDLEEKRIKHQFKELLREHIKMILQLNFFNRELEVSLIDQIKQDFSEIEKNYFKSRNKNYVYAQGEYLSTKIFHFWFQDRAIDSKLFDSLNYISTGENFDPDYTRIEERISSTIFDTKVSIFQGYICKNHLGEISNLQRGGSDYTATILGAAIEAKEVQIWTDIDGIHNNDPRHIDNTFPIRKLSFNEAAELAYFGAKILHPNCLSPVRKKSIPVYLKNTLNISNEGTLISKETSKRSITAIAAKDNIHVIRIESARMLNAHGFLYKIFSVFNNYKKPIDTITTSEVSVSITIDNDENIYEILNELQEFGNVEYESNNSIICVVGDCISETKGITSKIIQSIQDFPIRMISYGGSENNITLLIKTEHKIEVLQELNNNLFEKTENYARI